MRRLRAKIGIPLLAVALAVGWPVAAHYRLKAAVAACKQRLQAQGEKLSVSEMTPVLSAQGLGRAAAIIAASRQMGTVAPSNAPSPMRYIAPRRALLVSPQAVLPASESSNIWPGLITAIQANVENLEAVHEAVATPILAFNLDYSQGYNLLLPHLPALKGVAQWLSAATALELHEGHPREAWRHLQALVGLAAAYRDEPVMISELVRVAIGQIAVQATWEAINNPSCEEDELRAVQERWESMNLLAHAEVVLGMERATGEQLLVRARDEYEDPDNPSTGNANAGFTALAEIGKKLLDDPGGAVKDTIHRYPRYWAWKYWYSYEDELVSLQALQAAIECTRKAQAGEALGPAQKECLQRTALLKQQHPRAGAWFGYSASFDVAVEGFLQRVMMLEIERSLVVAAIALKRYQLRKGAYPTELAALTPEFLREVPRDPIDGKPLRYRLEPKGTFILYSSGLDGLDNGGDPTPVDPKSNVANQWWRARDAVWPSPATSEGIKTFFAQLAAKGQAGRIGQPLVQQVLRERYGLADPGVEKGTNTVK